MNFKSIFKHYWRFIRQHPWEHAGILFGYGIGQFGTIAAAPLIYKGIVDAISDPGPDVHETFMMLIALLIVFIILYNILFRIADYLHVRTQSVILKKLYDYALERVRHHSYTFFTNAFTGGLVAKSRRFMQSFEVLQDNFIFTIWMGGISLTASVGILLYYSTILGAIFLAWLISYVVLIVFLIRLQIPKDLAEAAADSKTTAHLSDIIANALTVKMFGAGMREQEAFAETTHEQETRRRRAWMQQSFWNGMFQGISIGIFNIALIWVAIILWERDVISAGTVVLAQVYIVTSFGVVWNLSKNILRISKALSDANEMVEIFDRALDVADPEKPEHVAITKGRVVFDNVSFAYEDQPAIFGNLSFTIEPGERVALVGRSGAGKTTVVKLILRFADIESGAITIDGQDVTRVAQDDLRSRIAYVPQEPLLFHRTLRENIRYAKPGATDAEVEEVSRHAHAHDFILNLPRGYDTLVGERGIKLSGGERQRVAIARAMLKDAPLLILDEATSSLDSVSEAHIQKAFTHLMAGRTTIVIAHRLSTIRQMDRVIVFDKGTIAEEGTHTELLKKSGIYKELWESQIGGFIAD